MRLTSDILEINVFEVERRIINFIQHYIKKSGASGVVVGMSGGIDSSVAAALCAKAINGSKVLGLCLPEKETWNEQDIEDARAVAEQFKIAFNVIDITQFIESFYKIAPLYDPADRLSNGNFKARSRMAVLYYYANRLSRLVMGTSDKSEAMLGYFTKWGDYSADISPLMDLFKSQVRQLAKHLDLPKNIIAKPSTPSLWPEHFAEVELGLNYDKLDLILYGLEHFMSLENIAEQLRLPLDVVKRIQGRWLANEHKRRPPLTLKLGYRTVGYDFRLPHTP
jgi:NAD+ synthase